MTSADKCPSIAEMADGDSVSGFALLTKKELRQDKNGRNFLDLELADASGRIAGKAWSGSSALEADFDLHDFVAFKGRISSYRDQLQINVRDCRRATEADKELGFDVSKLVPSTHESIDDLWNRLKSLLENQLERDHLRRLSAEALARYGAALREHPAAKMIHHAYRGGLLEHVVSMAELGMKLCDHYPELDRELVLLGVLFHDLGKIHELGAMPANEYTVEGRLVGHIVIGRDLLLECCQAIDDFPKDLRTHLEHLVLSHQGRLDYGSPIEPKTAEAMALHFIDDLDSKLAQLRQARENGPDMQFLRPLGRYVYFGLGAADSSPEDETVEIEGDSENGRSQGRLDLGPTR